MTQTPGVWRRVLARAAVGIWHARQTLIVGLVLVGAIGGYLVLGAPSITSGQPVADGSGDCADTVMAAMLGSGTPAVQQQAYNCMDAAFQQRVSQQEFTSQFQSGAQTSVSKVSRLGTYGAQSGAELVYYAVDSGQRSVGFVVYLNADRKVTMID